MLGHKLLGYAKVCKYQLTKSAGGVGALLKESLCLTMEFEKHNIARI